MAKKSTDWPNAIVRTGYQSDFREGLAIDYKWFDKWNIEPRFPFGFGLRYAKSERADSVTPHSSSTTWSSSTFIGLRMAYRQPTSGIPATAAYTTRWCVHFRRHRLLKWLVRAKITNTGAVEGAQVAQLVSQRGSYRLNLVHVVSRIRKGSAPEAPSRL